MLKCLHPLKSIGPRDCPDEALATPSGSWDPQNGNQCSSKYSWSKDWMCNGLKINYSTHIQCTETVTQCKLASCWKTMEVFCTETLTSQAEHLSWDELKIRKRCNPHVEVASSRMHFLVWWVSCSSYTDWASILSSDLIISYLLRDMGQAWLCNGDRQRDWRRTGSVDGCSERRPSQTLKIVSSLFPHPSL